MDKQAWPSVTRAVETGTFPDPPKPRILITVDGGVATVYAEGDCEIVQVDFDVFDQGDGEDIDDRRANVEQGANFPFDDWAERVWKEVGQ